MKNLYIIIIALFTCHVVNGQTDVELRINHKLGSNDFAYNAPSTNNLDHDFNINRLEYYIAEIAVTHDGGQVQVIEDLYILVDASEETMVSLGNFDMTQVESIQFSVGVDEAHNHLDPSTYNANHPLAPQWPSMHWGWTAGYRFVALEGNGGNAFNQMIQLHGLGDNNYFQTSVALNIQSENGSLLIDLDADYNRALEDIGVNSGIIVHGETLQAKQCLENFRDYVFAPADPNTSTIEKQTTAKFKIFPNPTTSGQVTIEVENQTAFEQIQIIDAQGKILKTFPFAPNQRSLQFDINMPGVYHVLLFSNDGITSKKLVIK